MLTDSQKLEIVVDVLTGLDDVISAFFDDIDAAKERLQQRIEALVEQGLTEVEAGE